MSEDIVRQKGYMPDYSEYDWERWAAFGGYETVEAYKAWWKEKVDKEFDEVIAANKLAQQKAAEEAAKNPRPETTKETEIWSGLPKPRRKPDKSAAKREEYNRKILSKENELDTLRDKKNSYVASLNSLINRTSSKITAAESLFDRISQFDVKQAEQDYGVYQDVFSRLRSVAERRNEELERSYGSQRTVIDEDIAKLYKEKGKLEW